MNAGVTSIRSGPAATTVVRLSAPPLAGKTGAAAVEVSQQREPRPIAALLSHVLARYGINDPVSGGEQPRQLDLFA
jgi:hypothetical protein